MRGGGGGRGRGRGGVHTRVLPSVVRELRCTYCCKKDLMSVLLSRSLPRKVCAIYHTSSVCACLRNTITTATLAGKLKHQHITSPSFPGSSQATSCGEGLGTGLAHHDVTHRSSRFYLAVEKQQNLERGSAQVHGSHTTGHAVGKQGYLSHLLSAGYSLNMAHMHPL